jgi:hypothetical protein
MNALKELSISHNPEAEKEKALIMQRPQNKVNKNILPRE